MLGWSAIIQERAGRTHNTLDGTLYNEFFFSSLVTFFTCQVSIIYIVVLLSAQAGQHVRSQIGFKHSGSTGTPLKMPFNKAVWWKIQVRIVGGRAFCYRPAIKMCLCIKQNHSNENEWQLGVASA